MSFTTTYDELESAMQSWSADPSTDYVAEIPKMISRAESRILKDLDLEIWEQDLGIIVSAGSRTATKPTDAIFVNEVFIRDPSSLIWKEVPKRSFSYCRMYAPYESDVDVPEYFAESSEDGLTFVPTPSKTYNTSNAKARCVIRPTGLSSENQNTWIGDHQADLLFQACMIEAYNYLKHPAKLQEAASMYQSLLPGISREMEDTVRKRYRALNSQIGADS